MKKSIKELKDPLSEKKIRFFLSTVFFSLFFLILSIASIYTHGPFAQFDSSLNVLAEKFQYSQAVYVASAISALFEPLNMIIFSLIAFCYLWYRKFKEDAYFFGITMLIMVVSFSALKNLIHEARPLNALIIESTFSYPSGHATAAIVFFGFLIYLSFKYVRSLKLKVPVVFLSLILILANLLSRLYLRVHWLNDVLGGIFLGAFILSTAILIREHFDKI